MSTALQERAESIQEEGQDARSLGHPHSDQSLPVLCPGPSHPDPGLPGSFLDPAWLVLTTSGPVTITHLTLVSGSTGRREQP